MPLLGGRLPAGTSCELTKERRKEGGGGGGMGFTLDKCAVLYRQGHVTLHISTLVFWEGHRKGPWSDCAVPSSGVYDNAFALQCRRTRRHHYASKCA